MIDEAAIAERHRLLSPELDERRRRLWAAAEARAGFDQRRPAAVLHESLSQELTVDEHSASVRLELPFAERGDVSLKKIGAELVVRVGGQKRTIMLPPALAAYQPTQARLADGALVVNLDDRAERPSAPDGSRSG